MENKHDLEINNSIGIYCDDKLINTFIIEKREIIVLIKYQNLIMIVKKNILTCRFTE